MNNQDAMSEFTKLCKAGKFGEAGEKFWADDVASVETAAAGPAAVVNGKKAVHEKGVRWASSNEVHGCKVEGPFPNGEQFVLRFEIDVTPKGQARLQMTEMGLFTLKNGKIVEERFFYGA